MTRIFWPARLSILVGMLSATNAQAWDPNVNGDLGHAPARYTARTLSDRVVPSRFYGHAQTLRYVAPVAVPAPIHTPVIAAAPVIHPAPPVEPPPMPTYGYAPAPEMLVQPDSIYPVPVQPTSYRKANQFSLGVVGFYDQYQEDIFALKDKGTFGGITAGYTHHFASDWYGAFDLKGAYGTTDYASVSGTIDNIPQWIVETRTVAGREFAYGSGNHLKAYIGLSTRYFSDELKGKISSTGARGYDRRIFQLFLPIGATYEFQASGLTFAPNLEVAPLLWGNVSSRLGTLSGYSNVENRQNEGYSIRSEFMVGGMDANGHGWQIGPFLQYWDMADSEIATGGYEPENTRLQAGVAAKWLF